MSSTIRVRLTPSQRLSRGVKYSTIGPLDVTRGAVGIAVDSVRSSASWVADRYRRGTIADSNKAPRRRRRLVYTGVGVAVLAGGAVTFSILRRSTQPDPSPLPPSVEVAPKI